MNLSPLLLSAALALLLNGCSILPKAEPVDIYWLPLAQNPAPKSAVTPLPLSLRIIKPLSSQALNNPNIAVVPQGNLISNYAAARWSDPAPALLRNRILDAFQRDGRIQRLSTEDSNLQADIELGGELQAFQTEYRGQDADVVIRLDARLVRASDQRIIATRRFEVRQPLSDKMVPGVVAGFGQASDKLTGQLISWVVEQGTHQYKAQ